VAHISAPLLPAKGMFHANVTSPVDQSRDHWQVDHGAMTAFVVSHPLKCRREIAGVGLVGVGRAWRH
jgi:hypothetical protein